MSHVHAWTEHPPATEGATAVSTCPCGLYRVELSSAMEPILYDEGGMKAMVRAFQSSRSATAGTSAPAPDAQSRRSGSDK